MIYMIRPILESTLALFENEMYNILALRQTLKLVGLYMFPERFLT
jgi:hypothetical protein